MKKSLTAEFSQPANIEIKPLDFINCTIFEHPEELIMMVKISGICPTGSRGPNWGTYLYRKIGLALLTIKPLAVLVDLRELEYEFSDRMLNLFYIFNEIDMYDGDKTIVHYILSEKNKYGLASLLQFNLEKPEAPFFYDADTAYKTLFEIYDAI